MASELFDPDEYEDGLRVLVREAIQNRCTCGSEATSTSAHAGSCEWKKTASRYSAHAATRVEAAKLEAAAEKDAKKAGLQPTKPPAK